MTPPPDDAPPMHDYVVLDVFTDTPLTGNSLAVFLDAREIPEDAMQPAARELNLSETVFLLPGDSDCDAHARIFTPVTELPFAGHPVLGAAFVVGGRQFVETVRLRTGAGIVRVALTRENEQIVFGEMEQPLPSVEPFEPADELLAALGVERAELPVEAYRNGPVHVFVAVRDEEQVAALEPDFNALKRLGEFGVSCFAGEGTRYKSRMFGPALGVPEDPATGSAAGPLALHLARHGWIAFGQEVEIRQGEEIGRPSLLRARVHGEAEPERVEAVIVGGSAVKVAEGRYRLQ